MTDIFSGLTEYTQPQFWLSVFEIIWINILLSGDNAIVIALACRSLPPKQRLGGMVLGTAVALAMRVAFASVVSLLMALPYIKIVGGMALMWVALKLLVPNEDDAGKHTPADGLLRAMRLIAVADIVMSLDNVIAVAAAADGNYALLVFGLGISVPAMVAGATIIMAIFNYFPLIIWAGAALLGWIAGDLMASDPIVAENTESLGEVGQERIKYVSSAIGAAGTIIGGFLWRRARQAQEA